MSGPKHTPGPWRWEVNEESKVVELCGGKPQYDLTVMDFERWGMGGAIPRFRDFSDHGLMTRCIIWARKVLGREHHSAWFKSLDHPDAHLIAAAPDLLDALKQLLELDEFDESVRGISSRRQPVMGAARSAIAKAEGRAE